MIRWSSVFADVDLVVPFDILKADVIVKKSSCGFAGGSAGRRQAAAIFLTARFDIPAVMVTNQAHQNGQPADLYAESLNVNQNPLEFVKDEKVVHKLRIAETYVLDANGEPI